MSEVDEAIPIKGLGNRLGATGIEIPSQDELEGQTAGQLQKTVEQAQKDGIEKGKNDSSNQGSLKIHINLDLDVEVHLTARVKGDITIGLL